MHYVCSDIHGQFSLYQRLLKELPLKDCDTLYVLGDMIDRGPDSLGIILDMIKRPNIVPFLGNHEWMMFNYLSGGPHAENWLDVRNSGVSTLRELEALPEETCEEVLSYLRHSWLQLNVKVGGTPYMLSHSSLVESNRTGDLLYEEAPQGEVFGCVWDSPYRFWEYADPETYDDGKIHIIGHVPAFSIPENRERLLPFPNPELGEKLLLIDGGCASLYFGQPGGLFCMSLEKDAQGRRKTLFLEGEPRKRSGSR